jgi:hypothetical protein
MIRAEARQARGAGAADARCRGVRRMNFRH